MKDQMKFEFVCQIKPILDKNRNINLYRPFEEYNNQENKKLHKYGAGPFCKFKIPNNLNKSGVYIIRVDNEIKYIGECENLSSRYNAGYGQISPRNCFVGGQPTNCKINSNILSALKENKDVRLLFYKTENRFVVEREMIELYRPEWNSTKGKYIKSSNVGKPPVKGDSKKMCKLGKYYALEQYLEKLKNDEITLSFRDIEEILGESLPDSARKYLAWWANGGHSQAYAWLNAGFKVKKIELGESITFKKEGIMFEYEKQRELLVGNKYRHFKGKEYLVLHLAKHSETEEELVVYQPLYGDRGIWVRPLKMFLEKVEFEGKLVNRFEEIKD